MIPTLQTQLTGTLYRDPQFVFLPDTFYFISYLSKDHFGLILNEPAGRVAKVIVENAVRLVVGAWDNTSINTRDVTENILECLFHPAFQDPSSQIQKAMTDEFKQWFQEQGCELLLITLRSFPNADINLCVMAAHQREVINRLTADSVRNGRNKRIGDNSSSTGHSHGSLPDGGLQAVLAQHQVHVPGASYLNDAADLMSGKLPGQPGFGTGGAHGWRDGPQGAPLAQPVSVGGGHDYGTGGGGQTYGHSYGAPTGHHDTSRGQADPYRHNQQPQAAYGQDTYQGNVDHSRPSYGYDNSGQSTYGGGNAYGQPSFNQPPPSDNAYSGGGGYGAPSYGAPAPSYGQEEHRRHHDSGFGGGPGYPQQDSGYGRPAYGAEAPQYGNFDGPPPHHAGPPHHPHQSYGGNNNFDGPPGGYRY